MTWNKKLEMNIWIRRFEEVLHNNFEVIQEELINETGYNLNFGFDLQKVIGGDNKIAFAVDKVYTLSNKKLWVLFLPVPEGYDSIGIKTDDNNSKSRVLKYNLIKYKNNNHSEIKTNNKYNYRGIYYWCEPKKIKKTIVHDSIKNILSNYNNYTNHYLIVSSDVNRTNAQGWNNLGNTQNLWLINGNANTLDKILNFIE